MSGHNKWSSIKHRKAAQDNKRGALFNKIIRELVVTAKDGGADPTTNFALGAAIDKAKNANMPKDTMEKAIKRGAGGSSGEIYERLTYEGRGPVGTAMIIETLTDNKNRTVAEIRHAFNKHGGSMGDNGSVAWMFERKGLLVVGAEKLDEDALMEACMEAGADDFKLDGEVAEIYTEIDDLQAAKKWFDENGDYTVKESSLAHIAKDPVEITTESDAKKVLRMLDALDDSDDVQNVFSNWSMSDELIEKVVAE